MLEKKEKTAKSMELRAKTHALTLRLIFNLWKEKITHPWDGVVGARGRNRAAFVCGSRVSKERTKKICHCFGIVYLSSTC